MEVLATILFMLLVFAGVTVYLHLVVDLHKEKIARMQAHIMDLEAEIQRNQEKH